jgi:PIN domain nuclease of toxin-antitoxin system
MRLLVDTCTFLWIATGDARLSDRARELFRASENDVWLSAVSAWEISVKHKLGKLPLPEPPHTFVPKVRTQHLIESLEIDEESTLGLRHLPDHHRDPFDRMLICQALTHNLQLLTPDPLVTQYPVRTVW